MKTNKRLLALLTSGLLAVVPVAATGLTAFAAGTSTLTITDTDTASHTYNAYQIIKGTKVDGKLTELTFGDGVNSATLISTLNTNAAALGINTIASNATAQYVAEELSKITDADKIEKLAKLFNTSGVLTTTKTALTKSTDTYSASTFDDGWYLVLDESTLNGANTPTVRSANLLQIVGNTEVNAKHSLPTLEKYILEDTDSDGDIEEIKANTAAIGDTVAYEIKTQVPDVTGYDKYFFIVEDTLSEGLTFDPDSIAVKVGTDVLTKDTSSKATAYTEAAGGEYYVDTTAVTGGTQIKVVFEDFLSYVEAEEIAKDTPVIITYNATLNEDASTDPEVGNPNTAKLVYSNDPNFDYQGQGTDVPYEPEEEDPTAETPGDVVGETPEDKVNTFTTAIKLIKIDQDGLSLKGATFKLTSDDLNKVEIVSTATFTADSNGTYWKLNNGSYTKVDPSGLSDALKAKYESTSAKYKKVVSAAVENTAAKVGSDTAKSVSATVDDSGILTITGLDAGTYTLTETGVPTGYNKAEDITFTISANVIDENSVTWSNNKSTLDTTEKLFPITIENRQGAVLPTTGGIGTKLFYILGSLLVAGSVVLLVTKKRMGAREE